MSEIARGNARTHDCLLCNAEQVDVARAFCKTCFNRVPWKLRADVINLHRVRISHQTRYTEKLIELWMWAMNSDGEKQ